MRNLKFLALIVLIGCGSAEIKEASKREAVPSKTEEAQEQPKPIEEIDTGDSKVEVIPPSNTYESDVKKAFAAKDSRRIEALISNKLSKDPNHLFSLNALGIYYYRGKATKLARLVWDKALKDHSRNAALNNNIGVSYLEEDEERAISFFKKAIQAEPSNPHANFNLGSIYLKYKNYSAAETALRVAYAKLKSYDVANNYALALKGNGKVNDSIKVYESLIRSNSNQYQALLNYATLLIETNQDAGKAKDSLNKVKFMTEDRRVLRYVADLERKLGK